MGAAQRLVRFCAGRSRSRSADQAVEATKVLVAERGACERGRPTARDGRRNGHGRASVSRAPSAHTRDVELKRAGPAEPTSSGSRDRPASRDGQDPAAAAPDRAAAWVSGGLPSSGNVSRQCPRPEEQLKAEGDRRAEVVAAQVVDPVLVGLPSRPRASTRDGA
jgi:hypothetical protein